MAGAHAGGIQAAQKNMANDPNFYKRIGSIGGKRSSTGGFAKKVACDCADIPGEHHKGQCAGKRGGLISRRNKKEVVGEQV